MNTHPPRFTALRDPGVRILYLGGWSNVRSTDPTDPFSSLSETVGRKRV